MLCCVDDAQWLDPPSAEALVFAARRFQAEPIALLMAARVGEGAASTLRARRARGRRPRPRHPQALLSARLDRPVAPRRRRAPPARPRGNPLALLELPSALSDAQLDGVEPIVGPPPVRGAVEAAFGARVAELPAPRAACCCWRPPTRRRPRGGAARRRGGSGSALSDLDDAEREGLVRDRRRRDLPPSARALRGLPRGDAQRAPRGPRGARGGGGRPGERRLAPRGGGRPPRRGARRRARGGRGAGDRARRRSHRGGDLRAGRRPLRGRPGAGPAPARRRPGVARRGAPGRRGGARRRVRAGSPRIRARRRTSISSAPRRRAAGARRPRAPRCCARPPGPSPTPRPSSPPSWRCGLCSAACRAAGTSACSPGQSVLERHRVRRAARALRGRRGRTACPPTSPGTPRRRDGRFAAALETGGEPRRAADAWPCRSSCGR